MFQHAAAAVRAMDALGSLLRVRAWQAPGLGLGLGRPAAGGALVDFAAAARRILLCLAGGRERHVSGGLYVRAGACNLSSVCAN